VLNGRRWAAGGDFTLADCAAAPALFYAGTVIPFDRAQRTLVAYFERLAARPSVRRPSDLTLTPGPIDCVLSPTPNHPGAKSCVALSNRQAYRVAGVLSAIFDTLA